MSNPENMKRETSQTVKDKRKALGLTQTELGLAARMDPSRVSLLENGKYAPNGHEQKRIARALQCEAEDLLFPYTYIALGV